MDTNTMYLARELGRTGVTIRFRTAVGDRVEEIEQVVRRAVERCDMVITTGGLGPTLDDVTREAVARSAGVDLEFRQDLMDRIDQVFRRYGYSMPENNRRQAFVPEGGQAIPNPVGTAPAFIKKVDGKPIICLPGVPKELEYLLSREVMPWLRQRFNLGDHSLTYLVLKAVGISESKVDSLIGDLMTPGRDPEVGLLASMGEIKIRISTRAKDAQEAHARIGPVAEEIRSRLGKNIYGQDQDSLEGVIDSLLAKNGLTLAILETSSGGFAAQKFHSLPSSCLVESLVIPDEKRVIKWLGQDNMPLGGEAALALAQKVRDICRAGAGLAILGFPKKKRQEYALEYYVATAGEGIERGLSWKMGGDLHILQQRGAITGLNTLRLALLDTLGE